MAVVLKSKDRKVIISSTNKESYHKFKKWLYYNYTHYTKFNNKNCYFFKNDLCISGAIIKANKLGLSIKVQKIS